MKVFVNRNIRGKWEKVEVSEAEIAEITKKNFVSNMNIAIDCVVNVRKALAASKRLEGQTVSPELADKIAVSLIDKMTKPLHYDIENHVDNDLASKEML